MSAFRCATATVPLDYADPSGKTIELAVVQHPATDPGSKIGTLFFNPGGPGGTGTGQFPAWIDFFPGELQKRFDIVSWDPRGIGQSTAVQCFDTPDAEGNLIGPLDAFPIGAAQEQQWVAAYAEFGRQCAARNGDLLEHVSTVDTARDLDQLRQAVGDDQLTFWGASYGSILGAVYANLSPDRVRALVLDGNVSPDAWTNRDESPATQGITSRVGSDRGVSELLQELLTLCGEVSTDRCAFSAGTPTDTEGKWSTMLDRLKEHPVTVGSGDRASLVTYPGILDKVNDALDIVQPSPGIQGWTGAAAALQEVWTATEAAASGSVSPAPSSVAAPAPASATSTATATAAVTYAGPEQALSVICGDVPTPPASAWPQLAAQLEELHGVSALPFSWSDQICTSWPAKAAEAPHGPWNAATSAPILVVGNTNDPSTPYANSQAMVKLLADASLLTIEGNGHTELLNPSACANGHIVSYLIDGTLPPAGTTCQQDKQPFAAS